MQVMYEYSLYKNVRDTMEISITIFTRAIEIGFVNNEACSTDFFSFMVVHTMQQIYNKFPAYTFTLKVL